MSRLLLALLLLPACTSFPQVDAAKSSLSADAVAPALLTAEELALLIGDPALADWLRDLPKYAASLAGIAGAALVVATGKLIERRHAQARDLTLE